MAEKGAQDSDSNHRSYLVDDIQRLEDAIQRTRSSERSYAASRAVAKWFCAACFACAVGFGSVVVIQHYAIDSMKTTILELEHRLILMEKEDNAPTG